MSYCLEMLKLLRNNSQYFLTFVFIGTFSTSSFAFEQKLSRNEISTVLKLGIDTSKSFQLVTVSLDDCIAVQLIYSKVFIDSNYIFLVSHQPRNEVNQFLLKNNDAWFPKIICGEDSIFQSLSEFSSFNGTYFGKGAEIYFFCPLINKEYQNNLIEFRNIFKYEKIKKQIEINDTTSANGFEEVFRLSKNRFILKTRNHNYFQFDSTYKFRKLPIFSEWNLFSGEDLYVTDNKSILRFSKEDYSTMDTVSNWPSFNLTNYYFFNNKIVNYSVGYKSIDFYDTEFLKGKLRKVRKMKISPIDQKDEIGFYRLAGNNKSLIIYSLYSPKLLIYQDNKLKSSYVLPYAFSNNFSGPKIFVDFEIYYVGLNKDQINIVFRVSNKIFYCILLINEAGKPIIKELDIPIAEFYARIFELDYSNTSINFFGQYLKRNKRWGMSHYSRFVIK